jgi:hypothetical protein
LFCFCFEKKLPLEYQYNDDVRDDPCTTNEQNLRRHQFQKDKGRIGQGTKLHKFDVPIADGSQQ